ncbi:Major intrinsic protein [Penicillium odoratum]|uniref:Major intrinsic protein n=1 Tax=Penicillium odoratum TaxID=1167516 RepID=UPI0025499192|nr:Major intrinsic protein [Penicillium odoratum]KAJ5753175.1 Major intrinsic protein [Penicillium odoratum]
MSRDPEHGAVHDMDPHEHEAPEGTQEDGSKNEGAGNDPTFSLAGPGAPNPASNAYIGDNYRQYNPQYGKEDDSPTWSLAQPLPHIVRPGMQHGALPDDRKEDKEGRNGLDAGADKHSKNQNNSEDGFFNTWSKIRHYLREPLAEWLGITVAMTIGLCATLSNYTSNGQAGNYISQSVAWGFGFMVAIYIAGGTSGGHLNPAFSIALSVFRGFPARKCVIYIAAQLLGAITAGGIAYAIYHDAIVELSATTKTPQNAGLAAEAMITAPKSFVHPATAFFTEFLGSAILFGAIVALGDDTNAPPGAGMQAFILGILISVVVLALGYNTGGCFNCARDFGPRLVAVMAGWGGHLFRETHAWWVWGPWCADISGALMGALVYDMAIFTGGESPINYPRRRRKRAFQVRAVNLRKKLGLRPKKTRDVESSSADTYR